MRWFRRLRLSPWPDRVGVLAVVACFVIGLWSWFIYNTVVEWRRNSELLAQRRASVAAHLLLEAVVRDMRSVQETVLSSPVWATFTSRQPHEISNFVAGAFARYPYPESFFVWQPGLNRSGMAFLNRSDRRPVWITEGTQGTGQFPVLVEFPAGNVRGLEHRLRQDVDAGRGFSAFHMRLGASEYQVVAEITYADPFRERVLQIKGFTVDLNWVRANYFGEMTRQVAEISGEDGNELNLSVFDDVGVAVVGDGAPRAHPLARQHYFPLLFFDPDIVALEMPADLDPAEWMVQVSAIDEPTLVRAISGSNRMLLIATSAAGILAIGVILTIRAERARARLADLRTDFVASVTHELKTPIASIRAAGETLARGRVGDAGSVLDYSLLVVTEAKRLSRLIENLLAHSRMADVADVYHFRPVSLAELFDDIREEFWVQLVDQGFEADFAVPDDVPAIHGDEQSLRLLFANLIDNAIKYSGTGRWIRVETRVEGRVMTVEVKDRGIGIAADEISQVVRKFVRGRSAPQGGSGLGLAIAARIARDHGGSLTIRSDVGRGTTVTVRLKLDRASRVATRTPTVHTVAPR